jgi:2-oxoglutarate dehydrogenase E2 component (dihydrolipoamide succinyltransferase)
MSVNIVVPDLSESVVEATIADWLKKVGDPVQAGEAVVVLETDKVSLEVTATHPGVLSSIAYEVGADVKPGDVLGVIAESGEAVAPQPVPAAVPAQTATPASAAPVANAAPAPTATPVARRVAAEHGVDLTQVPASSGRVTKDDVRSFINTNTQAAPVPTAPPPAAPAPRPAAPAPVPTPVPAPAASSNGYRREERVRMTRRRQTIAQRLVEAQQTAAMLTTFNEVDMSAVQAVRQRRKDTFKEKHGIGLGLSSFFVKAVIGALKAYPQLNAEIQGNEIVLKHYYDIGMAIGAKEGLVVPVLRDADRMSFAEIEKAIREYAKQSEEGTLSIEALRGGTFTITNGGVFGSLLSTPILNPPQVGILGLHGIKDRPVVVNGEIVVRPMMYTALTYDHRIVDGREAVQFLVKIKELIEDPETMLLEG